MNCPRFAKFGLSLLSLWEAGCHQPPNNPREEAPPSLKLQVEDGNVIAVEQPQRFKLAKAAAHTSTSQLKVTGTVTADISRAVPVISLASGRVIEIHARLGDTVSKGQLLLKVQSSDISNAYSDYQQAVADEALTLKQLERAQLLRDKGAIAQKDFEIAEAAEVKAKVAIKTAIERLRVLGADPNHPSAIVEIRAPISGVITDQQVTGASGVQGLSSPNAFTITDLSHVWIVCDVFENDLANVRVGETADIRLNADPRKVITGTISNIGSVLDANIRTAKVRIEVSNPGFLRPGMFVTAIFHGGQEVTRAAVPATAILHLHDQDWVYIPIDGNRFRLAAVVGGEMLPEGQQEIVSGLHPGQQVVANALEFQNTVQQE
jgi:cobalt-zinc-cadmium efflux system membrane fusion protein